MGSIPDKDTLTEAEGWSTAGAKYNDVIGATTAHGTLRLVDIVNGVSPFTAQSRIVDVGAGGGSLTVRVKQRASETNVLSTDIAEGMLNEIDRLNIPGVTTKKVDAVTLEGLQDESFTHGMSSFAIQFTPDPAACVRSLHRVIVKGGTVGVAIWGPYVGPGDIHIQACKILQPDYSPAKPEVSNAWRHESTHKKILTEAGFQGVETELVKMKFECVNTQGACDYWFRGTNPVPAKLVGDWIKNGGSKDELENQFRKLLDGMFERREVLYMDAVLGWGRKAS